jgi:hypothetical protein
VFFGIWEGVFGFIWFLGFVKYAIKVWNGAKISILISFALYYCAKKMRKKNFLFDFFVNSVNY